EAWSIPASWERGSATGRIIEPDNGRTLLLASNGWTPGTKGKITGDVVVVTARNKQDLEKYKGKLQGAVVLTRPPSQVRSMTAGAQGISGPWSNPGGQQGAGQGRTRSADGPPAAGAPPAQRAGGTPPVPPATAGDQPAGRRGDRGNFGEMMAFRRELNEFFHK